MKVNGRMIVNKASVPPNLLMEECMRVGTNVVKKLPKKIKINK